MDMVTQKRSCLCRAASLIPRRIGLFPVGVIEKTGLQCRFFFILQPGGLDGLQDDLLDFGLHESQFADQRGIFQR